MTRILGIAPYAGLKAMMESIASQDNSLFLDCYTADYKDSLKILSQISLSDYDVIISRAGTADLLKEFSPIPVLSIGMSYYDILNATTLAQSFHKPFALVGFPSTVRSASMLYDILKYDIPTFITNNDEEVETTLIELKKQNIHVVVGDNMITRHAEQQGMQSILIASGSESVAEAFQRAALFSEYQQHIRYENVCYQTAAKLNNRNILVLTSDGQISFTNLSSSQTTQFYPVAKKLIPVVAQKGCQQIIRRIRKKGVRISANSFSYGNEHLTIFEFTEVEQSYTKQFPALSMKEKEDISTSFLRIFYDLNPGSNFFQKITTCFKAQTVIITGEAGTGKQDLAEYLFFTGSYSSSVLFTFDCNRLSVSDLQTLFHSSESPLFRKGHVFFFHNFQSLTEDGQKQILDFLQDASILMGNQIIFSVQAEPASDAYMPTAAQKILHILPSMIVNLPPLRKQIHNIPKFITLYLNALATHNAHPLAGIEPEGLSYLQSFSWNGNHHQLCRVLDTLSQITTSSYIRTKDVTELLGNEELAQKNPPETNFSIDLTQSLDDIVKDVIQTILNQDGMNRTKAAKQLGICRATLWKYLK